MQKLSKFETLSSQKINVIVIKTAHGMSNFSKKLVRNYRFKKKICFKILVVTDSNLRILNIEGDSYSILIIIINLPYLYHLKFLK